jgi:hypothetical protein
VTKKDVSTLPLPDELPRLLRERNETLRSLARAIEGLDHAYLSRMVNRKAPVNAQHAERIARHLDLPPDYFPEVREAAVVAMIRAQSGLRDSLYFRRIQKPRRRTQKK